MKLSDMISEREKIKLQQAKDNKSNSSETKSNKLSRRDVEQLMGKYQSTYKRVRGAIRRR
jgi:hypothetical protein